MNAVHQSGNAGGHTPAASEKLLSADHKADQSTTPDPDEAAATLEAIFCGTDIPEQPKSEAERLMALMQASVVDPHEQIENTDYLFGWNGVDIMPRQNIVSLKAPAKSGKTFVLTAFATAFLRGEFGGLRCYASPKESILFVDTEQARNSTRKVLRRILKQAPGAEERIKVLNVRKLEAKERMEVVAVAVEAYRPTLIVVDGIADLIPGMDYNDQEQADSVITRLCALAEDYNAVVVTAIHTNKNDNTAASGWLGRILLQKCALEIGLSRKQGERTRTMQFVSRDREIPPISVSIEETEDGLGEIRIIAPDEAAKTEKDQKRIFCKTQILDMGFVPPTTMPRPEFAKEIAKRSNISLQAAQKKIARFIEAGALTSEGEARGANLTFDYEE